MSVFELEVESSKQPCEFKYIYLKFSSLDSKTCDGL